MIDKKGSTRHSGAPVAKIAKNFGVVKNIPPPPLPAKKSHLKEASFSTVYGENTADLRSPGNAGGSSRTSYQEQPTVFSPSRKALNLPPQGEHSEENLIKPSSRNQKIYFGHEEDDDDRTMRGNVGSKVASFQRAKQSGRERSSAQYDRDHPLVRNPTLGELLNKNDRPVQYHNKPVPSENPSRNVIARNPNPINFRSRIASFNGGDSNSIEADSLQASSDESARQNSPVGNSFNPRGQLTSIQEMALPEIPMKSGSSKASSRTLINLRHKQPVKEAVRMLENGNSSPRSVSPEVKIQEKQICKAGPSKFDISHDPEVDNEFYHDQCHHLKLIKSERTESHLKLPSRQNRKRLAPSKENGHKSGKRENRGKTEVLFFPSELFQCAYNCWVIDLA